MQNINRRFNMQNKVNSSWRFTFQNNFLFCAIQREIVMVRKTEIARKTEMEKEKEMKRRGNGDR